MFVVTVIIVRINKDSNNINSCIIKAILLPLAAWSRVVEFWFLPTVLSIPLFLLVEHFMLVFELWGETFNKVLRKYYYLYSLLLITYYSFHRMKMLRYSERDYKEDGLNSLHFTLLNATRRKLYTKFLVKL